MGFINQLISGGHHPVGAEFNYVFPFGWKTSMQFVDSYDYQGRTSLSRQWQLSHNQGEEWHAEA